jgi:exopolysaccharide biosynthesis polyprenyl glycosylphosphotransferase
MIGSRQTAVAYYEEHCFRQMRPESIFKGYVAVDDHGEHLLSDYLPELGKVNELSKILLNNGIREAIVAIEPNEYHRIAKLLTCLYQSDIVVKIFPGIGKKLLSEYRLNAELGAPFQDLNIEYMPAWQKPIKRLLDITVSLAVLILLSPIALLVSIIIKATSKGPVIFRQERIGLHGKLFKIHKFRSMYIDAEKNGPQLSFEQDPRVTPFGRFMRKVRLDEIPQFYDVLIGNMSIVGPRPERQYYIDQIMQKEPIYQLLLKVKPGITGKGQVCNGYTENLEEMIARLYYDLLYLERMSLAEDFRILLQTILIVIRGRQK